MKSLEVAIFADGTDSGGVLACYLEDRNPSTLQSAAVLAASTESTCEISAEATAVQISGDWQSEWDRQWQFPRNPIPLEYRRMS